MTHHEEDTLTIERLKRWVSKYGNDADSPMPTYHEDELEFRRLAYSRRALIRNIQDGTLDDDLKQDIDAVHPYFLEWTPNERHVKHNADIINRIVEFISQHGSEPSQGGTRTYDESYLGMRRSEMSRQYRNGTMPDDKLQRIKELGAESVFAEPKRNRPSGDERLKELRDFVAKYDRRPHPGADDETERKLAYWVNFQYRAPQAVTPKVQERRDEVRRIVNSLKK